MRKLLVMWSLALTIFCGSVSTAILVTIQRVSWGFWTIMATLLIVGMIFVLFGDTIADEINN